MREEDKNSKSERYADLLEWLKSDSVMIDGAALKSDWETMGKEIEKPLQIGFDFSPNPSTTVIKGYRWKEYDAYRYWGGTYIKKPTDAIVNKEQILAETSPPKRNFWQKIGLFFNNLYYKIKFYFKKK